MEGNRVCKEEEKARALPYECSDAKCEGVLFMGEKVFVYFLFIFWESKIRGYYLLVVSFDVA